MEKEGFFDSEGVIFKNPLDKTGRGADKISKVSQEQIHELLFGEKLSWQAIIYDLINTEQLDPWDVDLAILTDKYLVKVRSLEEANFFVSSKVLLAASLLLRIKSEILLNHYIPSLDDILFGKKEEKKYVQERIELDEEIPDLVPRTPLPRFRKVTLQELMEALGKAISTENRRIKKVVLARQHEREIELSLPKTKINLKDRIQEIYSKLKEFLLDEKDEKHKLAFSELSGKTREDKITTFVPLLHLDNQQKVLLEQETHFEEIYIWLKHIYDKKNAALLELMRKEVEEEMVKLDMEMSPEERERALILEEDFKNPLEGIERKEIDED